MPPFAFPTRDKAADSDTGRKSYNASRRIKSDEVAERLKDLQANVAKLDLSKVEAVIVLTLTKEDENTQGVHVDGVGAINDIQSMLIHALLDTKRQSDLNGANDESGDDGATS